MSDTIDWKRKHLDALREMEAEERRWRSVEQILRRLVQRLCAVAHGDDPRLDAQLDKLAAAARRSSEAVELEALFDSLTDAVRALERSAAVDATEPPAGTERGRATPAPPRLERSRRAVANLLERLAHADPASRDASGLRADLAAAADDAALARVLGGVAELVAEQGAAIARERAAAAAMLAQVTDRLEEMAIFLASASAERERDHADSESLNVEVLAQMTRLSDEARDSVDLGALRARVADRLESVAANVREFRDRARTRFAEHAARAERMRGRIAELEGETRALHQSLDLEKRRARTDPLTRVASRASFDERFAEELARWKRFRAPLSVLVWDVDHFKSVNDTCGHRGGDAVLREIARCLGQGRREVDFLARYGGEEFVTLLVGSPLADALAVAERMRAGVEALRFRFRGAPLRVTVSCGLTELREGDDAASVFDRADAALYRAKGAGRNCCVSA